MTAKRWQDWMILVLGAWLFFSPFVLDYTQTAAASNSYVIGLGLVLFAILALIDSRLWEEWANFALGAWLIISPFALGFSDMAAATWNHVIVGLLVAADAMLVILKPGISARATR